MIQPIFYRSAVRIHPVVAIVVVLAGAQLAGILGALLAIPIAASLGAIYDELWPAVAESAEPDEEPDGAAPAAGARLVARSRTLQLALAVRKQTPLAVEQPRPERARLARPALR